MTGNSVICHSLGLLIRLIDTTTGRLIPEHRVKLLRDGQEQKYIKKEPGVYGFIDIERKTFLLTAVVAGFETQTHPVGYGHTDCPIAELSMVPSIDYQGGYGFYTLEGNLEGIEAIEGVAYDRWFLRISSFDSQKNSMVLFNPRSLWVNHNYYGLIDTEAEIYEPFTVIRQISAEEIIIDHALSDSYRINNPVVRIVFGTVKPNGNYRFWVRDTGNTAKYLIRYLVKGEERFRIIDFKCKGELELEPSGFR